MASYVLYPPIVDSSMPAFAVEEMTIDNKKIYGGVCRVYFTPSKYNAIIIDTEEKNVNVQISITKQDTGEKLINTIEPFHRTGVILDREIQKDENNNYYVDIDNYDLINNTWMPGTGYKIQLRLSDVYFYKQPEPAVGESTWLNIYGDHFSEWSTICYVKATYLPYIYYTSIAPDLHTVEPVYINGSEVLATYVNSDTSEYLYSYRINLYEQVLDDYILCYDSGEILSDIYQDNNKIKHTMKYELKNNTHYKFSLTYHTINGYQSTNEIECQTRNNTDIGTSIRLVLVENNYDITEGKRVPVISDLVSKTSVFSEEEEGRIGYCLTGKEEKSDYISGVYYIRRTDSRSNFTVWEDIKKITKKSSPFTFDNEIFYDYTAESGVWYKYGIQAIDKESGRGPLIVAYSNQEDVQVITPTLRDYNYSFLVGQNEKQLKLMFDNTMGNLKINVFDSMDVPIGSPYPYSRRLGSVKYKTFPITGLISFNMDESNIFTNDKEMYGGYDEVANLYKNRVTESGRNDFIREKFFRDKVMEFLYDGKVKLFKSPTEGNILVKLTDISLTPNQQLSRLVYSFSATGTEIAKYNIDNCLKYKITVLDEAGNQQPAFMAISDHKSNPATHDIS